jgi:hypothetical protein
MLFDDIMSELDTPASQEQPQARQPPQTEKQGIPYCEDFLKQYPPKSKKDT